MRLSNNRLAVSLAAFTLISNSLALMHSARKVELREKTKDLWMHAYSKYKTHAFPHDELLPLSCRGQGYDRANIGNWAINDFSGDFSLTLVDSMDSFAIFGDKPGFENAVRETIQHVNFDVDSQVQLFEVTIRMLGGLLSGHILATDSKRGFKLDWYNDELLHLARDLGRRLLPAFETSSGIPHAHVNLRHGAVVGGGKIHTAGAGTLVLEFGTLSDLTNDPIYYEKARRAYLAVWDRRSPLDLVGSYISTEGLWLDPVSSTGAGIDSFFEYAAKAAVFFEDNLWSGIWETSYKALMKHIRTPNKFWYLGVNMNSGQQATTYVDSLSAFFSGTQILVGDIESAIKGHLVYAFIWKKFGLMPENFDSTNKQTTQPIYPLRPEFIESNLFLYQATRDDFFLDVAELALHNIINKTRVECGIASVLNIHTGQQEDKQPSYALSETLKYLYLTFDETNQYNRDDSNMVFNTEGHMLQSNRKPTLGRTNNMNQQSCQSYQKTLDVDRNPLLQGIVFRNDYESARRLVGFEVIDEAAEIDSGRWSPYGFCTAL